MKFVKAVVGLLLCTGLMAGCGQQSTTTHTQPAQHNVTQDKGTLKAALKEYKWVKVQSADDFRDSTGQLTVVVKLSDSSGDGGQVAQVINQTMKVWNDLDKKPKKLTVGCMEGDQRTFQFTTTDGKSIQIEKSTPYIRDYLKKTGSIK